MSFDDLEIGRCPYYGGDLIEEEDGTYVCEECGQYQE